MIDFSQTKVTIVGDVISDEWIYGTVDRLSPEGPWPVFVYKGKETKAGGASNVAQNIVALGGIAWLVAAPCKSIKYRYVVGRHQLFRCDHEDIQRLAPSLEDAIFRDATRKIPNVMVLSDYGKGTFLGDLSTRLIKWCCEKGIPCVVDPKGDWVRYHSATVITPNQFEIPGEPEALMRRYDLQAILLTKGAQGMTLHRHDAGAVDVHARGPVVVDTVGAGDTVVAAFALALGHGFDMQTAMQIANDAAAVVVGKPGTAVCTRAELEALSA